MCPRGASKGSSTWATTCCFPGFIGRKLDPSSQDWNDTLKWNVHITRRALTNGIRVPALMTKIFSSMIISWYYDGPLSIKTAPGSTWLKEDCVTSVCPTSTEFRSRDIWECWGAPPNQMSDRVSEKLREWKPCTWKEPSRDTAYQSHNAFMKSKKLKLFHIRNMGNRTWVKF